MGHIRSRNGLGAVIVRHVPARHPASHVRRDRRHYVAELRKGERQYERLVREAETAHASADRALAAAHRLDCDAWSTRQCIGGDLAPSPSIADAIHGDRELLEVRCKRCGHEDRIDLTLVVWPREKPVHSLGKALACKGVRAGRPTETTSGPRGFGGAAKRRTDSAGRGAEGQTLMPRDPYIRMKFTRVPAAARAVVRDWRQRYPKKLYDTEIESWRKIQSENIEFTMKRLREPKQP